MQKDSASPTPKASAKEPKLKGILNKRPSFIDNAYSKNLRAETAIAGGREPQAGGQHGPSQTGEFTRSNTKKNLLNEKTFLSFSSLGDFEESDENDQDADSLNGDITKYENACHGLMISTSAIVIKSLPTNSVILSNYGLNSVRVLALTNALKVNISPK